MKYKYYRCIKSVLEFEPISGYYLSENNIKLITDDSIDIRLDKAKKIFSFNHDFIVLDNLNRPYILENKQLKNRLTDVFRVSSIKFPFINYYKKSDPRLYGIYDYRLSKILFETDKWLGRDIILEYIFGEYQAKILGWKITSSKFLWQFPLEDLGSSSELMNKNITPETRQFIGITLEKLFILLSSREIIVLDINNGALIQRLSFIDVLIEESSIGWSKKEIPFFETNYILDEQRDIIMGLAIDLYYEIDVRNEVALAKAYSLKSEFEKYNINPQNISKNHMCLEGHLYFLDKDKSRFVILNAITKKIVFISDPITIQNRPDAWPQLKEIQVSKDKVYVLASDHTLHIFERTFN